MANPPLTVDLGTEEDGYVYDTFKIGDDAPIGIPAGQQPFVDAITKLFPNERAWTFASLFPSSLMEISVLVPNIPRMCTVLPYVRVWTFARLISLESPHLVGS